MNVQLNSSSASPGDVDSGWYRSLPINRSGIGLGMVGRHLDSPAIEHLIRHPRLGRWETSASDLAVNGRSVVLKEGHTPAYADKLCLSNSAKGCLYHD